MSFGSHTPVLLQAAVAGLKVRADGVYVDCTFGRGGHSREILAQLSRRGRLIALDRDPAAIAGHGGINDERLTLVHRSFSGLRAVLEECGVGEVGCRPRSSTTARAASGFAATRRSICAWTRAAARRQPTGWQTRMSRK